MRLLLLLGLLAFLYGESDVSFSRRQDARFNRGRGVSSLAGDPLSWPGAEFLESWHHWQWGVTYFEALDEEGAAPPTPLTVDGTIDTPCGLKIDFPTGGDRSVAQFRFSLDNGVSYSSALPAAAGTVALPGTTMVAHFPVGTYATNNVYTLKVSTWADRTGHGHTFAADSPILGPASLIGGSRSPLWFDGINGVMLCVTTLPTILIGGTNTAHDVFLVAKLNALAAADCLFFMGHGANLTREHWQADAGTWKVVKDDNSTTATRGGGVSDTNRNVFHLANAGSSVEMFKTAASQFSGALSVGAMTMNCASIGASFIGGAAGNKSDISIEQILTYRSGFTSGAQIASLLRNQAGL